MKICVAGSMHYAEKMFEVSKELHNYGTEIIAMELAVISGGLDKIE